MDIPGLYICWWNIRWCHFIVMCSIGIEFHVGIKVYNMLRPRTMGWRLGTDCRHISGRPQRQRWAPVKHGVAWIWQRHWDHFWRKCGQRSWGLRHLGSSDLAISRSLGNRTSNTIPHFCLVCSSQCSSQNVPRVRFATFQSPKHFTPVDGFPKLLPE